MTQINILGDSLSGEEIPNILCLLEPSKERPDSMADWISYEKNLASCASTTEVRQGVDYSHGDLI